MKKVGIMSLALLIAGSCIAQQNGWSDVEKVIGKKGSVQGDVFKVTFPRYDLHVKINGFAVSPVLALTSWIGIMKMGNSAMMMGDLVLLDKEVPAAESKLIAEKLQITAIHNHLVNESPSVKYIHFSGNGDAVSLARAIKAVIATTATPFTQPAQSSSTKPDWTKVEAILGKSGKLNGDLLQYAFPRAEKLTDSGMEMPAAMGMATGINFQMDNGKAATTGDFVLLADEVNPVIQALTANGITVTAVHNHMLFDDPRLFMLHFWAAGNPENLAKGLKAALDKTNSKK